MNSLDSISFGHVQNRLPRFFSQDEYKSILKSILKNAINLLMGRGYSSPKKCKFKGKQRTHKKGKLRKQKSHFANRSDMVFIPILLYQSCRTPCIHDSRPKQSKPKWFLPDQDAKQIKLYYNLLIPRLLSLPTLHPKSNSTMDNINSSDQEFEDNAPRFPNVGKASVQSYVSNTIN